MNLSILDLSRVNLSIVLFLLIFYLFMSRCIIKQQKIHFGASIRKCYLGLTFGDVTTTLRVTSCEIGYRNRG